MKLKEPNKAKPRLKSKKGFSLIEVMIAAMIMSILGFGTLSGLLQARRMTEGSIYLNTATTIAQGYIEQLKNMDFDLLDNATIDNLINQGNPDSLIVSPMVANPEIGNDETDMTNTRLIDINNTPETETDDLVFSVIVYIEDITDLKAGVEESRRIVMRYEYTDGSTGTVRQFGNTIYAIRSQVPSF